LFDKLNGKELSYNNLVDVDAAVNLMEEFRDAPPTFAVLKHTNVCGLATRDTVFDAWTDALAGDNISAFGGILISNTAIDLQTAEAIDKLFYEVLIAPDFDGDALEFLSKKKKRILLRLKQYPSRKHVFKSLLNGVVHQDADRKKATPSDLKTVTKLAPTPEQVEDLLFAEIIAKHLKSNTISIVKNKQLIGMGCGQTSRVDALKQAIDKAHFFGFDTKGAVMASDAFFPFPDCVEIAHTDGIDAVIQPGGSIKDQLSIDYCDQHGMAMVMTGVRHFRH
ncbi:MAG TPA: bifunctional phosphoribosylaminoimidazolecarboxamide formyltransferase/IMP cyclohydrolase PurH, partial [Gammaproteobacteria bacterium]|nr:bifunctional phosphoribosylaminoimidazolecarboxamide formyltransferase/IMP cyclohydrolase PurH [Gammaproteobacteria bacterium]